MHTREHTPTIKHPPIHQHKRKQTGISAHAHKYKHEYAHTHTRTHTHTHTHKHAFTQTHANTEGGREIEKREAAEIVYKVHKRKDDTNRMDKKVGKIIRYFLFLFLQSYKPYFHSIYCELHKNEFNREVL